MFAAEKRGDLAPGEAEGRAKASKGMNLPEHVAKPKAKPVKKVKAAKKPKKMKSMPKRLKGR